MAAGRDARVHDATGEAGSVTIDYRTSEDVLQSLPEGSGVWELVHQPPIHLPQTYGMRL